MIRYFEERDRQKFIELSKALHDSDAVFFKTEDETFNITFDMALNKSPYAAGYIIEENEETAGFALLTFSYSNEMGGIVIWLEELYIDEKFRNKGLGSVLLSFIEKEFTGKAAYVRLEVTKDNKDAIALYERNGFKELLYKQMVKKL